MVLEAVRDHVPGVVFLFHALVEVPPDLRGVLGLDVAGGGRLGRAAEWAVSARSRPGGVIMTLWCSWLARLFDVQAVPRSSRGRVTFYFRARAVLRIYY